jgi:hypothetical protein
VFAWLTGSAIAGKELPVDLELILAVDVSLSIDEDERQLQRQGWVAAFRSPEVLRAIRAGFYGRIAVAYVEWGDYDSQYVAMPWKLVDDEASIETVAKFLATVPINRSYWTSISGALRYSVHLFDGNRFAGERRVIDLSGDGPNNMGPPATSARDAAVAQGVTVNGLAIMIHPQWAGDHYIEGLDFYYEDCVIGGAGAFALAVTRRDQFVATIKRKLTLEIAGTEATMRISDAEKRSDVVDCLAAENDLNKLLPARPGHRF